MQHLSLLLAQSETPSPDPLADAVTGLGDTFGTRATPCPNEGAVCRFVLEQTGNGTLASLLGQVVPIVLTILLVFVLAAVAARLAKRLIAKVVSRTALESQDAIRAITRRAPSMGEVLTPEQEDVLRARGQQRADTIAAVVGSVTAFVIWMIATFIALSQLNIDVGPLVAGAGVVGVALGFGAQSLVRDFLSGIFMLLEDQYGVGDIIDVGEATGTVEAVTLRVTRLRDVEGTVWHVPNGEIHRVGNFSQLWSRSLLDIGVAYDTDLDHASRVLNDVALALAADPDWEKEVLEEPELWGVQQFGPSEVVLRMVIKTRPASQWKVNREFRRRLKDAFDREGIEIPFPQRTIWVKDGQAAGVPAAALPVPPGESEDDGAADTVGDSTFDGAP